MSKLLILARSPLGEYIVGLSFERFSSVLPIKKVKETRKSIAFQHPSPSFNAHILVVPKRAIRSLHTAKPEDFEYIQDSLQLAKEIVNEYKWGDSDYTIILNGGSRQEVPQLHIHLASEGLSS